MQGYALCTHESRSKDTFLGLMSEQWCLSGEDFEVELLTGGGGPRIEKWGGGMGAAAGQGECQAVGQLKQHLCLGRRITSHFPKHFHSHSLFCFQ